MNYEIMYVVITFVVYSFFGISATYSLLQLPHAVTHAYSKNMYCYLISY